MPPRYATDTWSTRFDAAVREALRPGAAVLEIGAGANPAISPGDRPPGCLYVGLDVDAAELAKAPPGSYDEQVVADVTGPLDGLDGRFDLVVTWMVLEHVHSLPAALARAARCLRPGGLLIAQFPGAFSAAAIANRLLPWGVTRRLLGRLHGRDPESVFVAHYDRCWQSALDRTLASIFAEHEVRPLYTGVFYVAFSRPLRAAYLAYEETAVRRGWANMAPYYLVTATADSPAQSR